MKYVHLKQNKLISQFHTIIKITIIIMLLNHSNASLILLILSQLPSPQQQIDCVEEIFRDGSRRFVETGRNNTINNAIDLFLSSIAESAAPFENLTDLTDDDLRNLDDGFYIQESFCDENNSQRGVSDDLIDLNF